MKDVPVLKILTGNVITASPDANLREVEQQMHDHKIRHIPVVENDKILGIVSLTDIQRLSFADSFGEEEIGADIAIFNMLKLGHVMISRPVTIRSDQMLSEAAAILSEKEFHALPVEDDGKLSGIITTTDILRYFLQNCLER